MLTILIASDHKPFREAITRMLLAQPLFRVMGVCADVHAAIAVASAEQPNIVLLDGSSDPLAIIEATKKIVSCTTANVIALSRTADHGFARHMLAAGALGFLTKQSPAAEIIAAINEVAKDNIYLCNELCPGHEQSIAPLPTPSNNRASSFESANRSNTRQKITAAIATHWHGILQFAN